jgi:hypothetical protein
MVKLNKNLVKCVLAAAMLLHGAAQAVPTYHVAVDTTKYSGQALMDFTFLANAGATPATAILSNFAGAFSATFDRSPGALGALPGQLRLGNQNGGDYLTELVELGGQFSFDISFEGDFAGIENANATLFNATLYKADFSDYIGPPGSFAAFELLPAQDGNPGGIRVSASDSLATVAEVPEPSTLLLTLGALAALVRLRRGQRAPSFPGPRL